MSRLLSLLVLAAGALPCAAAEPALSLSLNDSTAAEIRPGWPVVVLVTVEHGGEGGPLQLAPAGRPWPRAIRLEASGAGPAATDFKQVGEPTTPALTLPPGARLSYAVVLDEAATARLAPGRYALSAVLEIARSPGWNGTARSAPVTLTVKPGGALDAQTRLGRAMALATAQALRGQDDAALQVLREQVKADPGSLPALRLAAELLERRGDLRTAYVLASRAVELATAAGSGRGAEPPVSLLQLQARLGRALLMPK
jgi:hypothetical protein